jgi:hypothetical protein
MLQKVIKDSLKYKKLEGELNMAEVSHLKPDTKKNAKETN